MVETCVGKSAQCSGKVHTHKSRTKSSALLNFGSSMDKQQMAEVVFVEITDENYEPLS